MKLYLLSYTRKKKCAKNRLFDKIESVNYLLWSLFAEKEIKYLSLKFDTFYPGVSKIVKSHKNLHGEIFYFSVD